MISSRFDIRIPFYLTILLSVSFVLSIFALQLFAGLLIVFWLLEKNSEKRKAIDKIVVLIVIYGVVRIVAIIFSEYHSVSVQTFYKEGLFFLSIFSLGFYLKVFDAGKRKQIIYFFILGAALNSIIGLIRFNLGLVERAQSFSSGYTVFSVYLLAVFGVVIILSDLYEVKERYFYLHLILSAIILAGMVSSLGRADIAIAILILLAGIFLKRIKIRQVLLIGLGVAILSSISFFNNSTEATQRVETPTQLSDRDVLYKGAAELIREHPLLGYGPRTFKKIFPLKDELADKGVGGWHNELLQVYFESGVVGLGAYFALMIGIFSSGISFVKRNRNEESAIIVLSILISIAALLLSALFSGFIDSPVLSIVFALIVSILAAESYENTGDESDLARAGSL
jgi:O-antigen ligase